MKRSILFALLAFAALGYSQTSAPKYSNEFLKIGVSARAFGMGNAMTGITDDVTAGYWNPAGLAWAPSRPEFGLMHAEYFAGIAKYDYGAFTTTIDGQRRFGASFIRFGVDDIPNTLNLIDQDGNIDYAKVEKFSVADMALILSFAQKAGFKEGLSYGANFKVINRTVGKFGNAWGFGFDLGAQYRKDNWRFGLMLNDITTTFNAWSYNPETFRETFIRTGNVVPENSIELTLPSARFGAGRYFFADRPISLMVSLDADIFADGKRAAPLSFNPVTIDPHMGLEASWKKKVFLRGGYNNLQRVPSFDKPNEYRLSAFFSLGAGLKLNNVQIDYALSNVGNFSQVLYSHVFSLQFQLRSKKPE